MLENSSEGESASQQQRQKIQAEIYTAAEEIVETVATLLAQFAVAISAIDRLSYIHRGITNAHNLFFASFLKGLSNASGLEHTEGLQPMKDFKEAYAIQEGKFEEAMNILSNPNTDKSESFLRVPQKEMLALDRSARAFLLKHGGNEVKELLSLTDAIGHTYSAGSSAVLMNVARMGEYLGSLAREKLGKLKGLTSQAQLYFLHKLLSDEVLKGPIGAALKLDKVTSEAVLEMIRKHVYGAGTVLDAAQSLNEAIAPTLRSVKDAVTPQLLSKRDGLSCTW